MTYKNALAGLPHGGGKAVIVHDPADKPRELLHAFGRAVSALDGRYVTAGDVGMTVTDMDTIGETCRWTTGRSPENGGVGDSGILTAVGVHAGMRAGAESAFGSPDLAGVTVGVVGAGKVGGRLIGHLLEDGARVIALDPSAQVRAALDADNPGAIEWVDSLEALLAARPDVLSPNALGGLVTPEVVSALHAAGVRLVSGGANNQLATEEDGVHLHHRGILFAPDYVINAGGLIRVSLAHLGRQREIDQRVEGIAHTLAQLFERAEADDLPPSQVADQMARERLQG
jgi:valine dehydrogenase (NAD+)